MNMNNDKLIINYNGSAPRMEVEDAKRIFGRSVEKYGACYTDFYGNWDSKSYESVKEI